MLFHLQEGLDAVCGSDRFFEQRWAPVAAPDRAPVP